MRAGIPATSNDRELYDRVHAKRSGLTHPPTPLTLPQPLGQSLLAERDHRVNPGGSQRWDQACE
jgi:hypothetical protein